MRIRTTYILTVIAAVLLSSLAGCIKNDLPYPRIAENITALAVEGESKTAYIDSMTMKATVYLEETTDIQNVKFTEFQISPEARCDVDLLDGTYDLSKPLDLTIYRFQEYYWQIIAVQQIERYFEIEGEIGASIVDPVAKRVVVTVPDNLDPEHLTLTSAKLGPEGLTTCVPELNPGPIDLKYPLRVEVTAWGRTEIWTIYAEVTDAVVSTTQVDAWSKVIWAYGAGPADVANGFQYRKAGDSDWIDVPAGQVTQKQGDFSCYIPHCEELTDYEVRAVSGSDTGNIVKVTTEATMDIPNGSFDNWHKGEYIGENLKWNDNIWCPWAEGGEQFWDTGNTGSITLGVNATMSSDHTPTGTGKSAELSSQFVGLGAAGKFAAGSIYVGKFKKVDGMNGILNFGKPWTLRPTRLKGFYQYKSMPINYASNDYADLKGKNDTGIIYVALTDWTAPFEVRTNPRNRQLFDPESPSVIAYGELTFDRTMSGFQPFEIEIKYRDTSRVPSYLVITCSASKLGDYFTGGAGSTLWVDQLSFGWDY